ncbi:conserved membrane hypothetical protein [Desulfosarcina cetonica]|nr:conserved membrane hypothetical protein [Desulfosarcina cetonica]
MDVRDSSAMTVLGQGVVLATMLVGLPLIGIIAAGHDPRPYLEMPPVTRFVRHAGFSWPWFIFFGVADFLMATGLLVAIRCGVRHRVRHRPVGLAKPAKGRFPWWGWAGGGLCFCAWLLAWQRFDWFWLFQPHTFLPIWAGFILTINAWTEKRKGSCLITRQPLGFLGLFPASTAFWWFFEYLNRFVQNWYYTGIEGMGPGEYSYFSSLAFATVLPGVLSMIEWLGTFPALDAGLTRCRPVRMPTTKATACFTLVVSAVGLALIGIYPDFLFALVWLSPLLIALSLQALSGRPTLLRPLCQGDFRSLVVPALAALICGFFWEMWNIHSLARWTYSIPFVQRFHLFAMPVLGYGGYPPFGLICLMAGMPLVGNPFDTPAAIDP